MPLIVPPFALPNKANTPASQGVVQNIGSSVYILPISTNIPRQTLFSVSAIAADAVVASIVADADGGAFLRAGARLYMDDLPLANGDPLPDYVTVTVDTDVKSTPTSVPIVPSSVARPAFTTHQWGMAKVMSPTNIPYNLENTVVDRSDLNSFRMRSEITQVGYKPQISTISNNSRERSLEWAREASFRGYHVWSVINFSDGQLCVGRAVLSNFNADGNIAEIQRPTFNLEFQGDDYEIYKALASYSDTDIHAEIFKIQSLTGLPLG